MKILKRRYGKFYLFTAVLLFMLFSGNGLCQDTEAPISQKITLDIKGMDILDVLKILSMKSGLNIIAGRNVTGRVTIYLKDVDVYDALNIILIANNLAYEKKKDIINVMTDRDYELIYGERFYDKKEMEIVHLRYAKATEVSKALMQIKTNVGKIIVDEASNILILMDVPVRISQMKEVIGQMDQLTETRTFSLQYAKAEDIEKKVSEMITKTIGELKVDGRTNSVIVTDLPNRLKAIEKMISVFDKKNLQVLIEAKILEITLSDRYQFGIDWDVIAKKYLSLHQNLKLTLTQGGSLKIGALASGEEADEQGEYSALIEALRSQGDVNTLSAPKITAINNQESKILVGTKEPYATKTVVSTEATATTAEQVTFVDVGVKLYVTPTINDDGFVTMKIRPEVSSTGIPYTTSEGNEVPVVSTTEAETTVMVKNGSTIIIAGLIKDKQDLSSKKIPILGDVPLLGSLFKSRDDNRTKQEIIILLTPHIVSGETTLTEVPRYEKKIDLIPKVKGKLEKQEAAEEKKRLKTERIQERKKIKLQRGQQKETSLIKEEKKPPAKEEAQNEAIYLSDRDAVVEAVILERDYNDYYLGVRKDIIDAIRKNFSGIDVYGGSVVSFVVAEDGNILGEPVVIREDNKLAGDIALEAVKLASPFERFPPGLASDKEKFLFTISFE